MPAPMPWQVPSLPPTSRKRQKRQAQGIIKFSHASAKTPVQREPALLHACKADLPFRLPKSRLSRRVAVNTHRLIILNHDIVSLPLSLDRLHDLRRRFGGKPHHQVVFVRDGPSLVIPSAIQSHMPNPQSHSPTCHIPHPTRKSLVWRVGGFGGEGPGEGGLTALTISSIVSSMTFIGVSLG